MKKILLFSIALCAIVSCAKQEVEPQEEPTPIVFTASIDGDDSKTEVTSTGKVSWVVGDSITITNGTNTGYYYIKDKSDISTNRVATFTWKRGTNFSWKGNYTATYGNVSTQIYDPNHPGSYCPMEATATSYTPSANKIVLNFKNSCGVVAVGANTGDVAITKISLDNTTLYFPSPTKLNGTYLIAIEGGSSFKNVTFFKSNGSSAKKELSSEATITKNELRKMNTGTYFQNATYTDIPTLNGIFTVSNANKKVKFSTGNLQAVYHASSKSYSWQFAEHQYDIIGNKEGNTSIGHQGDGKVVDLFGFSTAKTLFGISTDGNNDSYGGDFVDWALAIGAIDDWQTLSKDEWDYLLNLRTGNRFAKVSLYNNQQGIVLYPDGYTGTGITTDESTTEGVAKVNTKDAPYPTNVYPQGTKKLSQDTWTIMENNGCVFVPSAFYRTISTINDGGAHYYIHYWSSTQANGRQSYFMYVNNINETVTTAGRSEGKAVRLVKVVTTN